MSFIESPGMIYDPIDHSFYDLRDGQLLAKMDNEVKSVFEDLYVVELEKEKTLVFFVPRKLGKTKSKT